MANSAQKAGPRPTVCGPSRRRRKTRKPFTAAILQVRSRSRKPEIPFGRIRTTMITATSRPIWPNSCPCQDVIADFTTASTPPAGAAGKGEAVDQARIDAERRGHVRHLDRGAREDAETGPIEQHVEAAKNSQRGCKQHKAVNGIGVLADLKAAERRA